MIRGQTSLSPSGPNTKLEPTNAKSSSRLIAPPSVAKTRWPIAVFSTSSAKTICSPSPTRPSAVDGAAVRREGVGDAMMTISR